MLCMRLLITTQVVDTEDPILGFFHWWIIEFSKHFDRVDVICLSKGSHNLPSNVFVHSLGKEEGENRFKYIIRFYRFFWNIYVLGHIDFVFFHMGAILNIMAAPFFFVRKLKRTQFLWWKTKGEIDWLGRTALLFVDGVRTGSEESFPIVTAKKKVVGSAVDTDLFALPTSRDRTTTLLFVGRIMPIKNVEHVIQTTKKLKDGGREVRTRIVGGAENEAYLESLHTLCEELEVRKELTFVGPLNQEALVSEYQNAHFAMNPSDTDSFDKVVIEAMACGSIPLTSNETFRRILAPYCLFVEKGDIEGYANTINTHLSDTTEDRMKLLRELHDIVITEHSLTTLSHRVFDV